MTEVRASISPALQKEMDRAQRQAVSAGFTIATVTDTLREIVVNAKVADSLDVADMTLLIEVSEILKASEHGETAGYVRTQQYRVIEAATRYASADGRDQVTLADYVVAAMMASGDQLPTLDGRRLAISRAAREVAETRSWLTRGALKRATVTRTVSDKSARFADRSRVHKGVVGAFAVWRSWVAGHVWALEVILFLPGLLVREALWVVLAWFNGADRRARSFLGVKTPTGLTRVVPTRARVRVEALIALVTFVLGVIALAAWIVPQQLLQLLDSVDLSLGSEQELIATSILNGGGVLGLGPWIPWSLLALSIPGWEQLRRLDWTSRLYSGVIVTGWVRLMTLIGTLGRPVDVALGAIGLPAILGRGLVVIVPLSILMRMIFRA